MIFNRLLPAPAAVNVTELLDGLAPAELAPADRPYVAVNFIASTDGRATFKGRSSALGDPGDREMFHGLREQVDAVLAGTGTLSIERYGRLVPDAERRARRIARGLEPEPLACVISRSGELPHDIPLFATEEQRVLVFSGAPLSFDPTAVAAEVEVVEVDRGSLTGTAVLRRLRADHGIASVLCEGGPTLFSALLHEGVVDELFLTIAPMLAGGGPAPAITTGGELAEPAALALEWALEREGSLFLRYRHSAGKSR